MAAQFVDEEEAWKCPKHPSRRRRTGICHVCLRERLASLCPYCAHSRPCPCASTSSASTSSSSGGSDRPGIRVSSLIDGEPSFRRSRSVAIPFLRHAKSSSPSPSLWSMFKGGGGSKSKRVDAAAAVDGGSVTVLFPEEPKMSSSSFAADEERRRMMRKSRSVAVTSSTASVSGERGSKGKGLGLGWNFPSPMKVFRQSISRGLVVNERSPMHR